MTVNELRAHLNNDYGPGPLPFYLIVNPRTYANVLDEIVAIRRLDPGAGIVPPQPGIMFKGVRLIRAPWGLVHLTRWRHQFHHWRHDVCREADGEGFVAAMLNSLKSGRFAGRTDLATMAWNEFIFGRGQEHWLCDCATADRIEVERRILLLK